MSSSDDDSQQRFALGFLFALIALVISVVVGTVVVKRVGASGAAKPAATAVASSAPAATAAAVADDAASVRVENGVVKFYFATAKAELAKQRAFAVRDALKALGVAEDKIELKKPEETTATGSNAEARRVEVALGA